MQEKKRRTGTLIATWKNGIQRIFENVDELNITINKGELDIWCEQHNFAKPTYEVLWNDEVPA